MVTQRLKGNKTPVLIVDGSTTYRLQCDGEVTRIRINDRPQAIRVTDAEGYLGQHRDPLIVGGIVDAFAGRAVGPWSRESIRQHLSHGHIHALNDAEAETRFGVITAPRAKLSLTMPSRLIIGTEKTSSIFGEAAVDATAGGQTGTALTRQMFNDRPTVYFAGSSVVGVFGWEALVDTAGSYATIASFAWTGSGFSSESTVFNSGGTLSATAAAFDMAVHKGALFIVGTTQRTTAAANQIYSTTDGSTWASAGVQPVASAFLEGTRLLDDGNTLWLIAQLANKVIALYKSTNSGGSWTTVNAVAAQGQIRSVFKYRDPTNTQRLCFMTENQLYWIDETNNIASGFYTLRAVGRGAIVWGQSLYLFMDAMTVVRYLQTSEGRFETDISPGGGEAMPSGKDFRYDTDGSVVVAAGQLGPVAAWSGDGPTSGTLNRTICLQWVERVKDGEHVDGHHFGWRAANTTNGVGYTARALAIDPVSGDLLYFGAGVSVGNETRATQQYVRITKFETDPRLLTTNVYETAGYAETPLISLPPTSVSTTFWDMYYLTEMGASTSIQTTFGVDGAVATTSTLDTNATTVALARRKFPTDATAAGTAESTGTGVGSNFSTIRLRWTFVATATATPLVYACDIGFSKRPNATYIYVCDFIVDGNPPDGQTATATTWANLKTIANIKTKVSMTYSKEEGAVYVAPIGESEAVEMLHSGYADSKPRDGTWRMFFAEI